MFILFGFLCPTSIIRSSPLLVLVILILKFKKQQARKSCSLDRDRKKLDSKLELERYTDSIKVRKLELAISFLC